MKGRLLQSGDEACADSAADSELESRYVYDAKGRVSSVSNGNVSRGYAYDGYGRLNRETVTIDGRTRSSSYGYDGQHRPVALVYHGGEVITTTYGSPGVAVGLSSSEHGVMVDGVKLDEAGRMTALRFPAGGNLWRTQSYYGWKEAGGGGMLASLKVGLREGGEERLSRGYVYNGFGEIATLREGDASYGFAYDGLGRLKSAYGRTYAYDGASRLTTFNGQTYGYGDAGPYHAVDRIGGQDRFDYDANGNVVKRNKGLDGEQALVWDAQNRLSQVRNKSGDLVEQYWYGVEGARVKKTSGGTTTYTFFAHYEEEVTGTVTTAVSHYSFGGLRFAVKRGAALHHLHGDHLGSTSLTTDTAGAATASRAYYAYGAERSSTGELQTDRTFTGQKRDATGLMYYNARYYDPALGTFVSPDSLVPDPGMVVDYNRFHYARGNPLRYVDPTGHNPLSPEWERGFAKEHALPPSADDRRDRLVSVTLRGPATGKLNWGDSDWQSYHMNKFPILIGLVAFAGVGADQTWNFADRNDQEQFLELTGGVLELANKIGTAIGGGVEKGLFRLRRLLGGFVTFSRQPDATTAPSICENVSGVSSGTPACAQGTLIEFYGPIFGSNNKVWVGGTVVHELAHIINNHHCVPLGGGQCQKPEVFFKGYDEINNMPFRKLTGYAMRVSVDARRGEYWAEGLAVWVYGSGFKGARLTLVQATSIDLMMQR